uniref:Inhibitor of growth protein N-terminal histone-binding domain-containing protein n=1 Tax=Chromera velia CCMP2878 TaxID=1169474 RepID=A0A0G4FCQ5_9ALVE|mmetsp:Transcript_2889/g.5951  ORF Transcript_2889/g.5951 Transcript_2889/m.5951 type:complete len:170 (-) Transcript_2889:146-655(-)|eukprot:Cvel_16258.t1-p1 / transcript=Cvel_16258.t1 / gene=Cvel_16258 / organism=Chromera_velia_CCMP2878 / gene_product=hypothetical protein / transcript_product=hypothetical protein / location=Cvel_scaffold1244:26269-26775(+) / protein_length=169 / sequence_SO=supercontig / SO=protein_coding / is_pseudo=false
MAGADVSEIFETILDELTPVPGWLIRNMRLMRELDTQCESIRVTLEQKRDAYLTNMQVRMNIPSHDPMLRQRLEAIYEGKENGKETDKQLQEITQYEKDLRAVAAEKVAIAYKVEQLIKHYTKENKDRASPYLGGLPEGAGGDQKDDDRSRREEEKENRKERRKNRNIS